MSVYTTVTQAELESWLDRIQPSELLYNVDVSPAFEQRLKTCACPASTLMPRPACTTTATVTTSQSGAST